LRSRFFIATATLVLKAGGRMPPSRQAAPQGVSLPDWVKI
jgi:hypothetical protein